MEGRGAEERRSQPAIDPRIAAACLVLLGPLAFTPAAIVDSAWVGPQMLGAGLGSDPLFALFGIAIFAGAVLPLLCLAVALPAWRGERYAQRLGVALALLIAALSLTPLSLFSPLSWFGPGRWLLLAAALGVAGALAVAARGGGPGSGSRRLSARPVWAALSVAALLLLAGAIAGRVGDGIPMAPSGLLISDFDGGDRLTGEPLWAVPPRGGAGLKSGQGSNIHHDAAMSDTYLDRLAVDPRAAQIRSFEGLGDCASIVFDRHGRLLAICVGGTRIVAYLLHPSTLEPLAERRIGDRTVGLDFATNFAGGGYAVLDDRDRLIVPGADGVIRRWSVGGGPAGRGAEIEPLDSFDVAATLRSDEPITSALPDASRRLWYVGADGTVGLLDPRTGVAHSLRLAGVLPLDEVEIENSFALAPGGGAFVVTSEQLVRVAAQPSGRPRIVWAEAYDSGGRQKPGQTSRGSGTTPSVMLGGRYVAITDNAEPRMHVQVYDAGRSVRGSRLVCEVPVFPPGESATENSLIVAGRSIFVENNYGYKLLAVTAGHTSEPGAARIDLDPDAGTCETVWANEDVEIPSVVSKVSAADGTVLTYTKPPNVAGIDAWYFTALDAGSGEVLWKRLAGTGPLANNHYAALYLGPSGDLYVGTVGGVIGLVGLDG